MSRKVTQAVFSTSAEPVKLAPRKAPKLTAEEKADRSAFVEKTLDNDAMATLIAEKKRIEAQLREARKANRLEDENAKQSQHARWHYHVTGMITRRMQAGQSQEEAIEGALAALRAVMVAKLAEQPVTDEASTTEE